MSSSDQDRKDSTFAQDCTDGVAGSHNRSNSSAPPALSFQSCDAGSSPIPHSSSSITYAPSYIGSSSPPSSRAYDRNTPGVSQDQYESEGAPSNPLSNNLISKVKSASRSPISSPAVKIMPPMHPSALQPPVPGQASLSRASFSYNVNPNFSQQAMGNMNLPKELAMPSAVTPPFQLSVSGRSTGLSSNLSDSVKQDTSAAAQLTLPENISHNGTAQAATVNSSEKEPVSISNLAVVASSSGALQSTSSVPHFPTVFNPNIPPTPHVNVPPFMGPPSSRPILQSPVLAQQNHPNFPLINPSPQAIWMHPSHAGHQLHRPFGPYNGSIPAFPLGMQNMASYVPLPNMQPPGISGPVSSMGVQSAGNGLVQAIKDFGAQSAPLGLDNVTEPSSNAFDVAKNEEANAWTSHRTETGTVYYYNRITGKSTYEKPSCFAGEPKQADAQPTPFSWEKIAGTDWTLVATSDGKKYYYNNNTKVSSWQIPPEVLEQKKNQENEPLKEPSTSQVMVKDNGLVQKDIHDTTSSKAGTLVSPSALDLIKKKLHDSSSSAMVSSAPLSVDLAVSGAVDASIKSQLNESSKEKEETNGDGNATESSSDSEEENNGPSKEECIIQFKEMLKERGVAPFSKWEKELPKILFDPRFKAVESHSVRRSLFELYVRTRAEEERKEKRAAQKALVDGFKQLLDDASEDIHVKTDYQAFKRKWGDDPRFSALGRKEREVLLNERINCLKKEDEEKVQALLVDFKSMLRESALITSTSRWSRVKDSFRDDPRYRSVRHDDREVFFNEYMSELKAVENEVNLASKAKMDEHEKLKKREEEMRKKKQREEQEMEAVRLRVRRKQAESSYQALLVEKIKDPKASWTESKPKLEKDPQERAKNPDLSSHDMEKLFREHIKNLVERCARDYQALLSEVITMEVAEKAARTSEGKKTILTSWSEAKNLLRSDPRYSKMPSKDREMLWSRFVDDLRRKLHVEAGVEEGSKKRTAAVKDSGDSSPKRRHR